VAVSLSKGQDQIGRSPELRDFRKELERQPSARLLLPYSWFRAIKKKVPCADSLGAGPFAAITNHVERRETRRWRDSRTTRPEPISVLRSSLLNTTTSGISERSPVVFGRRGRAHQRLGIAPVLFLVARTVRTPVGRAAAGSTRWF